VGGLVCTGAACTHAVSLLLLFFSLFFFSSLSLLLLFSLSSSSLLSLFFSASPQLSVPIKQPCLQKRGSSSYEVPPLKAESGSAALSHQCAKNSAAPRGPFHHRGSAFSPHLSVSPQLSVPTTQPCLQKRGCSSYAGASSESRTRLCCSVPPMCKELGSSKGSFPPPRLCLSPHLSISPQLSVPLKQPCLQKRGCSSYEVPPLKAESGSAALSHPCAKNSAAPRGPFHHRGSAFSPNLSVSPPAPAETLPQVSCFGKGWFSMGRQRNPFPRGRG